MFLIDMDDDPDVFLECVRAAAVGYLLKDASSADVISVIRAVPQGQAICPSATFHAAIQRRLRGNGQLLQARESNRDWA